MSLLFTSFYSRRLFIFSGEFPCFLCSQHVQVHSYALYGMYMYRNTAIIYRPPQCPTTTSVAVAGLIIIIVCL